jgi:hypothetical protein
MFIAQVLSNEGDGLAHAASLAEEIRDRIRQDLPGPNRSGRHQVRLVLVN